MSGGLGLGGRDQDRPMSNLGVESGSGLKLVKVTTRLIGVGVVPR